MSKTKLVGAIVLLTLAGCDHTPPSQQAYWEGVCKVRGQYAAQYYSTFSGGMGWRCTPEEQQ